MIRTMGVDPTISLDRSARIVLAQSVHVGMRVIVREDGRPHVGEVIRRESWDVPQNWPQHATDGVIFRVKLGDGRAVSVYCRLRAEVARVD